MGWVWWLLAPLAVTSAAALVTWIAGRPRRPPTSEEAVVSHRRFLADLADASAPAHRARSGYGPFGDHRPNETQNATAAQLLATQPVATQPVSAQPAVPQPVSAQPAATQPAATQPVGTQVVGTQVVGSQSSGAPPVSAQPTNGPAGAPGRPDKLAG